MTVHFAPPPPAAVSRLLARFDRAELAAFITVAIDLLDLADGDVDEEDDERSGVLMIEDGIDYDGAEDNDEPDGLPGVPEDAEDGDEDACSAHDDDPTFSERDWGAGDPDDAEADDEDTCVDDQGEREESGGVVMQDTLPLLANERRDDGTREQIGVITLVAAEGGWGRT